ncbi:hypothetical protein HOI71_22575, partial [Candidatus Poribacteria bacterium]|nr:hypothetical protein [Candidatus Poribacteria bacterium]
MPSRSGAARQAIARQRSHIDGLFTRVTEQPDPADTLEFQSEWAGYLCVRISGAIEISVQSIFLEYATSGADERVQRFMQRRLRDRNMNTETILRICGLFDPEWRRNIDDTL